MTKLGEAIINRLRTHLPTDLAPGLHGEPFRDLTGARELRQAEWAAPDQIAHRWPEAVQQVHLTRLFIPEFRNKKENI